MSGTTRGYLDVTTTTRQLFERALELVVTGEPLESSAERFTEDVRGWSPNISVSSRDELEEILFERQTAFTNLDYSIDTFDVMGNRMVAEWRLAGDHTGSFIVAGFHPFEGTGRRMRLAGATIAELRAGRICSFRNYFDDAALLEQLFLPEEEIKSWRQH